MKKKLYQILPFVLQLELTSIEKRKEIPKLVDKRFLTHSCIKNNVAKISFSSSKFLENGNDIDIIAIYKVKLPNPFTLFNRPSENSNNVP